MIRSGDILGKLRQIPLLALIMILAVGTIGVLMQYSAAGGDMRPWAAPHLARFAAGVFIMIAVAMVPLKWLMRGSYFFYGGCLLLLVFVEVMGHMGGGAQRWIALGPLNLQPSEMTKLAVILMLARYLHAFPPLQYPGLKYLIVPVGLVIMPAVLILKQPNLGTTLIIMAVTGWILFAAGVRLRYFIIVITLGLAAAPVAWHFMHDYQKQRVMTFLDPSQDPLGSGYNITQSMIAIGSGGINGKGFLKGSQAQLDFLPEKQTDFIFTMLTEETGFIGGLTVLGLFTLLIWFSLGVALRCRNLFGSVMAQGVAAMLFFHMFVNTAMVMGMLPVVGLPLPLLSYGGSMQLSIMIGFGLMMNAWVNRDEKVK
ncbi:MAG: rod shape-determining protein RodA [Rickettsiales bacterium]